MRKRALILLFAVLSLSLLAGCSANPTPHVSVDQCVLYTAVGEAVTLPAATIEQNGIAVDGSIKLTVYSGNTSVAEFDGKTSNSFIPSTAGVFVAEYSAEYNGVKSDIKQKRIIAEADPETLSGVPSITVDCSEAVFASYSDITLRAAAGVSSSGADISANIKVTLIDSMSREIFSGQGNTAHTRDPLGKGTYIAVYTLEDNGMKNAVSYLITVIEGENVIPKISAPTADIRIFANQTLKISSAKASDPIEGDITDLVKVHIEDENGNTVLSERAANQSGSHIFNTAGKYKVIYSCKNSKGITAPDTGYSVTVLGSTSTGIKLDGVIDELEYADIPAFRTGLGGNTLYYFYSDADNLYVAAYVTDTTLIISDNANTESALNTSDGIELMIDPSNNTQKLNAAGIPCIRIRVGADGKMLTYVPAKSGTSWQTAAIGASSAVSVYGTISNAGVTKALDPIAADTDVGYSVEIKIPWTDLGFSSDPFVNPAFIQEAIGIAFGHRDVSNPQYHYAYTSATSSASASNNTFYNGMHYIQREEVANTGICPAYYNRLHLRGETKGVNPLVYSDSLILDGFMEKEFWADAEQIPYGVTGMGAEVDAYVKTDKYGLYIGVYIHDTQLISEPRSFHGNRGIKFNDRLDLRIADESTLAKASLPKASTGAMNITNGKIMFLDPSGAAQMHMLQAASARCIAQLPYAYATVTNGTTGYSKSGNLWNDGMFVADTDIHDVDEGWGTELFIPWSSLNMKYPEPGKTASVGVVVSILDRDAAATNTTIINSLITSEGRAKSQLGQPDSYYIVKTVGE